MYNGVLFVISGPSGTGKGCVCKELLKRDDIFLSISSTTRDIRANEVDGETYNYISVEKFERLIKEDQMLEWAKYNGNYYGTPKHAVKEMLENGKNVILEIEPQGAFKIKDMMPEAVLIFITPPSIKELQNRLNNRGRETKQQIKERVKAAKWEIEQACRYNYIVENLELEKCVEDVSNIIDKTVKEHNKVFDLLKEVKNYIDNN